MAEVMIWNPIERVLWGLALAIYLYSVILYLKRGKERENPKEKILLYSFSGFLFCIMLFIIFLLSAEYFIPGTFKFSTFYGDYELTNVFYEVLMKLSWISFYVGFMWHFTTVEFGLKRTKYIPTIISIASILLYIIIPLDIINSYMIYALLIDINAFAWFLIMIMFINQSQSEFKTVASYIISAGMFESVGILLGVQQMKVLNIIPIWISPLFFCLGGTFFIIPMLINPRVFSKSKTYWLTTSFFTIGIFSLLLILSIVLSLPTEFVGMGIFGVVILIYVQYIYSKNMKSKPLLNITPEINEEDISVLKTFTRPQRITEEEVIFHKEKKICLVCKGEVSRKNYICPECKAFYCIKCSDTLAGLENACWVCNVPFDESLPTKPFEKKDAEFEADVKIEGK